MKKILIAEDNKLIRLAVTKALHNPNYEILEVEDGWGVLNNFKNHSPDLIILDIKMPDMNGLEVLKRIRTVNRELPIIIITAYKGLEKDPEIVLGNVTTFITKPFDMEELKNTVIKNLGEE